jgi:hypothetical protein
MIVVGGEDILLLLLCVCLKGTNDSTSGLYYTRCGFRNQNLTNDRCTLLVLFNVLVVFRIGHKKCTAFTILLSVLTDTVEIQKSKEPVGFVFWLDNGKQLLGVGVDCT